MAALIAFLLSTHVHIKQTLSLLLLLLLFLLLLLSFFSQEQKGKRYEGLFVLVNKEMEKETPNWSKETRNICKANKTNKV